MTYIGMPMTFLEGQHEEVIDGVRIVRGGGQGSSVESNTLVPPTSSPSTWSSTSTTGFRGLRRGGANNCVAYLHEVLGPIWQLFISWPLAASALAGDGLIGCIGRSGSGWVPNQPSGLCNGAAYGTSRSFITDRLAPLPNESKPLALPLRLIAVSRLAPTNGWTCDRSRKNPASKRHRNAIDDRGQWQRLKALRKWRINPNCRTRHFTGQLTERKKTYSFAGRFVGPHFHSEGWGLNVLEANAMGTARDRFIVDGLVDATIDGQNGNRDQARDAGSVAEGIMALLKPRKISAIPRTGVRAHHWEFQWSQICRRRVIGWRNKRGGSKGS